MTDERTEPDAEPDVRNDPIPLQPGDPAPEDDPAVAHQAPEEE